MAKVGSVGLIGCAVIAAALGVLASARADAADRFAASLDRPAAVQKLKPKSADDPVGEIDCTWYADLMVRETGTDSPDPNDATLVPLRAGGGKPACGPTPGAGSIPVKTEGFALVGRKGGFLIWDASDPNGAEPFMVMSAGNGRILFSDALSPTPGLRRTASLEAGVLRLSYVRGYNASCSLVQDARRCWAKLVAAGAVAGSTPPLKQAPPSCRAAYKGVGADDPSLVVFATEVTVDAAGKAVVVTRGPASCLPQP